MKFIERGTRVLGSKYQTWFKSYQIVPKDAKYYLEALGKVWYDLNHAWYLEPKTLVFCPMNFTIDSENPSFLEIREGKLYSRH